MTGRIKSLTTYDVRFPTSLGRHGSDAMNPEPDYSAAYVVIGTDSGVDGHGLAFTIGRGNDVQVAAIQALEPYVIGYSVEGASVHRAPPGGDRCRGGHARPPKSQPTSPTSPRTYLTRCRLSWKPCYMIAKTLIPQRVLNPFVIMKFRGCVRW